MSKKPRVQIQYEVETEDGVEVRELPFVVGVIGDFAGDRQLAPLAEREFIEINKDNFDNVMAMISPTLSLVLPNPIGSSSAEKVVPLEFKALDDFTPDRLIQQVPELKALKQARDQLRDLLSKADCSRELSVLLEKCLKDPAHLLELSAVMNSKPAQGV